jgi:hypothetical protein
VTDIKKKGSPIVGVEEKNKNLPQTLDNLVTLYKQAKNQNKTRQQTFYAGKVRAMIESKNPTFTSTEIDEEMKKLGVL